MPARALAYIVCTDELLDTRARSVAEMRLIGTLCTFAENATHDRQAIVMRRRRGGAGLRGL